jgi:hypothetical protein
VTTEASDVLQIPIVYEIVVGDFGRAAAIDYLRMVSERERTLIRERLASANLPFFDEYRRIMFAALGDVAFYKKSLIDDVLRAEGHLSRQVLIGGGMTPVSREIVDRVATTVAQTALAALARGYERIRIAIPCNALSDLAVQIGDILQSPDNLDRLSARPELQLAEPHRLLSADLAVRTVPEAVLRLISKESDTAPRLLLLGAAGALAIYERMSETYGVEILEIRPDEQELVDEAVVAAIGGEPSAVQRCRELLLRDVINPRREELGELTVVEACTDFSFGLGVSSLEMFAEDLVQSCYA